MNTRRTFLKRIAAVGIAAPAVSLAGASVARGYPASSKVRHAGIGVRGMGGTDLREIAKSPHIEVTCLCDIDDRHLDAAAKDHPKARRFNDFRRMFDEANGDIDSCHVTVPDHMHAPITMTALLRGKNVYCQKPLTHEIVEARQIRLAARKAGVVTQMGTQIHSHSAYRTAVDVIRKGTIGKVSAVHTWADRNWGNNGRPTPETPPPEIHWDLWLGVAAERPFGTDAYHPKQWWSWMDFGTGNLGDMGCHLFDPVVKSLELGTPTRVRAECPAPENETWPRAGKVHFEFPRTPHTTSPVTLTWYDGGFSTGHHPASEIVPLPEGQGLPSQGSLFFGEKGVLLVPHWSKPRLLPVGDWAGHEIDEVPSVDHWLSFVDACRGEGETSANFEYAGPFTETVLLGNLAKRFPNRTLLWDSESLRVTNFAEANEFTMRTYRRGWEVEGLG